MKRAAWGLLGVALLAGVGAGLYRQRVLPVTAGTLTVTGAKAPVRIERDSQGIPTIRAASPEDAWFGLGFAHAQDRLWQMETHRRIGAGRLAEAFGPSAVDTDRFLRALAVRRAAATQWARLEGEARGALLAYAAGVNAFLQDHLRARPPEFLVLGLQPEPWDPVDSLAWMIMMAWDLGGNWSTELLRMRLALQLPVARINELLPPYPGTEPLPTADYAALVRQWGVSPSLGATALRDAPESGVEGVGSNNWVVAGSRTHSGKPLLANDPHLKLSAPALWYFARLEAPGLKVAGATMPGLPVVVLGQNEHIAWGFTNTNPDVQDLYLERIDPADPGRYQTPQGWARFERFAEVIRVKGGSDVPLTVRATRHGPVISDADVPATRGLDGAAAGAAPRYALSLRWTALDPDAGTVSAALRMNRARSAAEFVDAAQGYVAPMQNMVVADAQGESGHIAWVAAGRVPRRGPAHDLQGLVPAPGWDARYDWQGYLAPTETPRDRDPARGWIATANQRIHGPDYPHYLTSEWAAPYRQQRIEQLLEAQPRHDRESLAAIQADVLSLGAQALLPRLKAARSDHALAAKVAPLLAAFEGEMAADAPMPALFHAWVRHLTERVLADELGPLWGSQFGNNRSFRDAIERILARDDPWWCDDKRTAGTAETCQAHVDAALGDALEELRQRLGDDPSAWRWGELHTARAEHRPFSRVKALAGFFELRVPVPGDTHTVNVSRVNQLPDPTTGERYLTEHGPSLRALYDLADPSQSRFMHSSGQSGIPLSPLYRSFARDWAAVRYVPVWGPAEGQAPALVLQPAR
jgi:penicillin amidase